MQVLTFDFQSADGRLKFWGALSDLVKKSRSSSRSYVRENYARLLRVRVRRASGAADLMTLERFRLWWFDDFSGIIQIEIVNPIEEIVFDDLPFLQSKSANKKNR